VDARGIVRAVGLEGPELEAAVQRLLDSPAAGEVPPAPVRDGGSTPPRGGR